MHTHVATAISIAMIHSLCNAQQFKVDRNTHIQSKYGSWHATIVTARADKIIVSVRSAASLASATDIPEAEISIARLAKSTKFRNSEKRELLAVNGGFSGSETFRPVGLLISNGRIISAPNYQIFSGRPTAKCPHIRSERYRLSGLVCRTKNAALSIAGFNKDGWKRCTEALQTTPVLVGEKKNLTCENKDETPYNRTAICMSKASDGTNIVRTIITLDPVTLYDFAQWLSTSEAEHGLGCDAAVNLSGDTSSGAVYQSPANGKSSGAMHGELIGEGIFPQASVIVITSSD
jgi:uncharacterized protein YigE (DUF2233 family)